MDTKTSLQTHLPDDLTLDDFAATLWENLDIGVAIVGEGGDWIYVNPQLCEIVGYSWQELKYMTFQDITVDDDLYYDLNLVDAVKKSDISNYILYKRYRHKLGHEIPIRLKVIPLGENRGNMTVFLSQITHITPPSEEEKETSMKLVQEIHSMNSKGISASVIAIILLIIITIMQIIQLG